MQHPSQTSLVGSKVPYKWLRMHFHFVFVRVCQINGPLKNLRLWKMAIGQETGVRMVHRARGNLILMCIINLEWILSGLMSNVLWYNHRGTLWGGAAMHTKHHRAMQWGHMAVSTEVFLHILYGLKDTDIWHRSNFTIIIKVHMLDKQQAVMFSVCSIPVY